MSEQSTETDASARSPTVLADLAMLVTVTIWAINNVMVKTVIDTISPMEMTSHTQKTAPVTAASASAPSVRPIQNVSTL